MWKMRMEVESVRMKQQARCGWSAEDYTEDVRGMRGAMTADISAKV